MAKDRLAVYLDTLQEKRILLEGTTPVKKYMELLTEIEAAELFQSKIAYEEEHIPTLTVPKVRTPRVPKHRAKMPTFSNGELPQSAFPQEELPSEQS